MTKKKFDETAKALATLYAFSSIQGILENGTIADSSSRRDADAINRICRRQMQRLIKKYDKVYTKLTN